MTKKVDIEQTEIEAPYELPDGWKWIPLLESFENKTSSNKKLPTKDYSNSGKFAVVDQGQEFIGGYSDKSDFVFDGELPIIVFGDHTKCIKYIDFPFIQGADGVKILKPISSCSASPPLTVTVRANSAIAELLPARANSAIAW